MEKVKYESKKFLLYVGLFFLIDFIMAIYFSKQGIIYNIVFTLVAILIIYFIMWLGNEKENSRTDNGLFVSREGLTLYQNNIKYFSEWKDLSAEIAYGFCGLFYIFKIDFKDLEKKHLFVSHYPTKKSFSFLVRKYAPEGSSFRKVVEIVDN